MEKIEISAGIENKKRIVSEISEKMKNSKTLLIASIKNLPSSQFQEIKKKLREHAEIRVFKKSIVLRAISKTNKGALQNLKDCIKADVALFFSDLDVFKLSGLLSDNQSPAKAKKGDIALEDISVESGPTDLLPGPAISELGAVGLKIAVENGKLSIKNKTTLVKKGEEINEKVANVLGKLNIFPMKVGFIPLEAFNSVSDKVYKNILIDKKGTLEKLREFIGKSIGFSIKINYLCDKTISIFIRKAALEEKIINSLIGDNVENKKEENTEKNHKEEE